MSEASTLARPYANAAFEIAKEQSLEDWSANLKSLSAAVEDEQVQQALALPSLSPQDKSALLMDLLGKDLPKDFISFVRLLSENNRIGAATEISESFDLLKHEAQGELVASVFTAHPISDVQHKALIDKLSARFGKSVSLEVEIQKELIGGAIIKAGDLVLDGSVAGKLTQLQKTLQ